MARYGSGHYLKQLSKELKREGVIDIYDEFSELFIQASNAGRWDAYAVGADGFMQPSIHSAGMKYWIN